MCVPVCVCTVPRFGGYTVWAGLQAFSDLISPPFVSSSFSYCPISPSLLSPPLSGLTVSLLPSHPSVIPLVIASHAPGFGSR